MLQPSQKEEARGQQGSVLGRGGLEVIEKQKNPREESEEGIEARSGNIKEDQQGN